MEKETEGASEPNVAAAIVAAIAKVGLGKLDSHTQALLDEQTVLSRQQARLTELKIQSLVEQNAFELSHLRFRRSSDYARFALELAIALICVVVLASLVAMVWTATNDNDLVVEAFSVPPDIAESGMTGGALAARVLDSYGRMQADTFSLTQGVNSYRGDTPEQIRVEIPNTGISIGDVDLYVRRRLGHETRITGDLVHTPRGLALTVRYGDAPGATMEAPAAEINTLVGKAAERLYRSAQPFRYADYLSFHKRFAEAEAMIAPLATRGTVSDRALAYVSWATLAYFRGDNSAQLEYSQTATQFDSTNATAWYLLSSAANNLGHEEASRNGIDKVLLLLQERKARGLATNVAFALPIILAANRSAFVGDSQAYIEICADPKADVAGTSECSSANLAVEQATLHNLAEARRLASLIPATLPNGDQNAELAGTRAFIAARGGDWGGALRANKEAAVVMDTEKYRLAEEQVFYWPSLSETEAMNGNTVEAETIIGKTALDCDACVRARGRIASAKHDWAGAARWFSMVSARSPHVPFADFDWGEMLLNKGDLDGAIAKFRSASHKGPHFADPFEKWGEALIRENRSDLAMAKFEEADHYAPSWGRLHLKWAEALLWAGHKELARNHFAIARGLSLSASERAEFLRVNVT
jgi:hypothetical protein